MVGQQRKFCFLGPLEHPFLSSFLEYIIFKKKINIGRESTNSQQLISFRKLYLSQLTLQGEGNLINQVLIQGQ